MIDTKQLRHLLNSVSSEKWSLYFEANQAQPVIYRGEVACWHPYYSLKDVPKWPLPGNNPVRDDAEAMVAMMNVARELLSEREKLIRVLKEARAAIALEDARLESGELRLGQWTPLNGVREAVRDSKEIEA